MLPGETRRKPASRRAFGTLAGADTTRPDGTVSAIRGQSGCAPLQWSLKVIVQVLKVFAVRHTERSVGSLTAAGFWLGVFISTTAVMTSLPARTKQIRLAAQQPIRQSGMVRTILRPIMICGAPRDRNLSRLLALPRRVPVLPIPGGRRHFQQTVHVADVAGAMLSAGERSSAAGTSYDAVGPAPLTFADLPRISADTVGSRARLVPVPLAPVATAARCYERLSRRLRIRTEQPQRLAGDKPFAIDDAVHNLGYAPRPFADGILTEARALGMAR